MAVVNPSKQALEHWAQENGISMDFNSLCEDARAKSYILEELSKIAKEKKVFFYLVYFAYHYFNLLYLEYMYVYLDKISHQSKVVFYNDQDFFLFT